MFELESEERPHWEDQLRMVESWLDDESKYKQDLNETQENDLRGVATYLKRLLDQPTTHAETTKQSAIDADDAIGVEGLNLLSTVHAHSQSDLNELKGQDVDESDHRQLEKAVERNRANEEWFESEQKTP